MAWGRWGPASTGEPPGTTWHCLPLEGQGPSDSHTHHSPSWGDSMALGVTRGKRPSRPRREQHRPSRHPQELPRETERRTPCVGPGGRALGRASCLRVGAHRWTRFPRSRRHDRGPLLGRALESHGNFIYLFLLFSFRNPHYSLFLFCFRPGVGVGEVQETFLCS